VIRVVFVLAFVSGCRSEERKQIATPVQVELTCDEDTRMLSVTADLALDTKLCEEAWDAIDVVSPGRVTMLKVNKGRELWLRANGTRAIVEVRSNGKVTDTIDRVTALRIHPSDRDAARNDLITLEHAGTSEQLDARTFRRRFTDHSVREASLCAIADSVAGPEVATITVYGDDNASPLVVTRQECAERGLFVKFSGQGAVRLRQRDGTRVFTTVRRIVL
jgi:hypothetical protein